MDPIKFFYFEEGADGAKVRKLDEVATEEIKAREAVVWAEAWSTPQAEAWHYEPWRWPIIAEYCRLKVTVERDPGSNAALVAQLHRYREQIGLTPAGLRLNGWSIARDQLAERREQKSDEPIAPTSGDSSGPKSARERRLNAVGGSS